MNSKLPIIFLAFLLAVAFVLTSAKKQKKKKSAKVKKTRVIQPAVIPRPQVVQPAEPAQPVTEIKTEEAPPTQTITEAAPPVAESPVAVPVTPPPTTVNVEPAVTQPAPESPKPVEFVPTQPLKEFPKEVVNKNNLNTNMGKVKVKISPVDEWPDMTPEDRIEDLKEASKVLRPFYSEYTKDQYQQLVRDSEEYLKNPVTYDPSKASKVKGFLESLKSRRNEVSSKGEVEVIGPLE